MKKQNKAITKKDTKKAAATKELIKLLVKKDLEAIASGGSAVSCGGPTCITNCK